MNWSDTGIVLSARLHGETSTIVHLVTKSYGRHAGLVRGGAGKKKKSKQKGKKKAKNIAYYTIPVDFEIKGNFLGYIKFKRALSLSNKMLNFDKETIKVVQADTTGAIKVNGTLTIVGLASDF